MFNVGYTFWVAVMALRPGFTVESMKSRGVGKLPGLLGIELLSVEDGLMTAELKVREELLAPNGYLRTATVVALADTMCGYGCIAHLPKAPKASPPSN